MAFSPIGDGRCVTSCRRQRGSAPLACSAALRCMDGEAKRSRNNSSPMSTCTCCMLGLTLPQHSFCALLLLLCSMLLRSPRVLLLFVAVQHSAVCCSTHFPLPPQVSLHLPVTHSAMGVRVLSSSPRPRQLPLSPGCLQNQHTCPACTFTLFGWFMLLIIAKLGTCRLQRQGQSVNCSTHSTL